jgi:hypothetical protein
VPVAWSRVGEPVADFFDTLTIPAHHARFDRFVRYDRAKWALQLNLKNLASERYYETDAVQGWLLPAAPFSPEVTVRVKW